MKTLLGAVLVLAILGGGWALFGPCCGLRHSDQQDAAAASDAGAGGRAALKTAGEAASQPAAKQPQANDDKLPVMEKAMTDTPQGKQDWAKEAKEKLTPEQYNVCFLKGTEPPGSGKYEKFFEPGMYHCAVCGAALFASEAKYDSHSGWPAFWDAADAKNIQQVEDNSLGMRRTEVQCKICGAHLGHVFDDGPPPTRKRYCINSLALEFKPDGK